jgi:hypothetical protein
MTTCGNNTRKILQALQKQFSRLAISINYGFFYVTKAYGLQETGKSPLPGLFITPYVRKTQWNRAKKRS